MSLKQSFPRVVSVPLMESVSLERAKKTLSMSTKHKILVLPALYREFDKGDKDHSAMEGILPTLAKATYVNDIVIGLDGADEAQYKDAIKKVEAFDLPQNVHILWNDSPEMTAWRNDLAQKKSKKGRPLAPTEKGKGRNVWGCSGYALALLEEQQIDPSQAVIALHDCDIVTYDELLVARLFQPMCMPEGDHIEYVKGNYIRYNDNGLNGRVTRLFGPSFFDTVANVLQHNDEYNEKARGLVSFVRAFNYTFSGEMAFSGGLLEAIELPNDYSMEIRLLEQAYRLGQQRGTYTADVEIAHVYDHHHQGMDGLEKMAAQIAAAFFDILHERISFPEDFVKEIEKGYKQRASKLPEHFALAAAMSDLPYNKDKEVSAIQTFVRAPGQGYAMMKDGMSRPAPSWAVTRRQVPEALGQLLTMSHRSSEFRPRAVREQSCDASPS